MNILCGFKNVRNRTSKMKNSGTDTLKRVFIIVQKRNLYLFPCSGLKTDSTPGLNVNKLYYMEINSYKSIWFIVFLSVYMYVLYLSV